MQKQCFRFAKPEERRGTAKALAKERHSPNPPSIQPKATYVDLLPYPWRIKHVVPREYDSNLGRSQSVRQSAENPFGAKVYSSDVTKSKLRKFYHCTTNTPWTRQALLAKIPSTFLLIPASRKRAHHAPDQKWRLHRICHPSRTSRRTHPRAQFVRVTGLLNRHPPTPRRNRSIKARFQKPRDPTKPDLHVVQ